MSKKNIFASQKADIIRKLLVALNNAHTTPRQMALQVFG
jgi:hypothetical protein